jgi:hypothetical protein
MRLTELQDGEEDVPIIYDIIKTKLADKVKILLAESTAARIHRVHGINYEPADANLHARVWLYWVTSVTKDGGVFPDNMCSAVSDLKRWKLTKVGDHWELTT